MPCFIGTYTSLKYVGLATVGWGKGGGERRPRTAEKSGVVRVPAPGPHQVRPYPTDRLYKVKGKNSNRCVNEWQRIAEVGGARLGAVYSHLDSRQLHSVRVHTRSPPSRISPFHGLAVHPSPLEDPLSWPGRPPLTLTYPRKGHLARTRDLGGSGGLGGSTVGSSSQTFSCHPAGHEKVQHLLTLNTVVCPVFCSHRNPPQHHQQHHARLLPRPRCPSPGRLLVRGDPRPPRRQP